MKEIVILGSTGSIGVQALEIVASHPESFRVVALAAGSGNLELLARQAEKFKVPIIATTGDKARLQSMTSAEVIDGPHSASQLAAIPADAPHSPRSRVETESRSRTRNPSSLVVSW
jgi:1-deoxy-D-xylulose-5-phosphate reductoisomerase